MKNFFSIYTLAICFSFLIINPVHAALVSQSAIDKFNTNIDTVAKTNSSYDTTIKLENIISTIIHIILSVLGIIFLVLMFLAGNDWMMAAGNEEKIKKAQGTIQGLLIGLCLVLVAYAFSSGFSTILAKVLLK